MIENHRSGLLWDLFMNDADINKGLERLEFTSPHIGTEYTEESVIYDIGQFEYQQSKDMTDEHLNESGTGSKEVKFIYSKAS